MEPNNFSDLIFPDPFAKHEFECQVAQAQGQVCRYRSLRHYAMKAEKWQSVLISKKKKKCQ
jgi:hypothetical protein